MGIEIGNEINSLLNRINASLKSGTSVSSSDDEIFSEYLKKNYDDIDKDKNNSLSKTEIEESMKKSNDTSVQQLLQGNKLEGLMASIDLDKSGSISQSELDKSQQATVKDVVRSAIQKYGGSNDVGVAAGNLANKFLSAYNLGSGASNLVASAVNMIL